MLITVFLFQKIQTTELKYLCLPGEPLDAFPTLLRPSGEQIRGREWSQEKKMGGGGSHMCLSFLHTSITQHKQVLSVRRFLHGNLHLAPAQTCDTLTALHRFRTSFQLLIALCFVWVRGAGVDTTRITSGSSPTRLLYVCFDFADAEGRLGLRCEVCHHAIKAQRRL